MFGPTSNKSTKFAKNCFCILPLFVAWLLWLLGDSDLDASIIKQISSALLQAGPKLCKRHLNNINYTVN